MSNSRSDFIKHIHAYRESLSLDAVINAGETGRSSSKLLRNGLAVVGFNALEDFFKSRIAEALTQVGHSRLAFTQLPEGIRKSVTIGVVSSLNSRLRVYGSDADKIRFIQDQASKIASTTEEQAYDLTEFAYGYNGSNVNSGEIHKALKDFQVPNPWQDISRVSSKVGLSSMPLKEAYDNAFFRRHRAAHAANADTLYQELSSFLFDSLSVAVALDIIVSECVRRMQSYDGSYLGGGDVNVEEIECFLLKYQSGVWKVFSTKNMQRAKKVFPTKDNAVAFAQSRARECNSMLLVYSEAGVLENWE